jgi:hypothetical protein
MHWRRYGDTGNYGMCIASSIACKVLMEIFNSPYCMPFMLIELSSRRFASGHPSYPSGIGHHCRESGGGVRYYQRELRPSYAVISTRRNRYLCAELPLNTWSLYAAITQHRRHVLAEATRRAPHNPRSIRSRWCRVSHSQTRGFLGRVAKPAHLHAVHTHREANRIPHERHLHIAQSRW